MDIREILRKNGEEQWDAAHDLISSRFILDDNWEVKPKRKLDVENFVIHMYCAEFDQNELFTVSGFDVGNGPFFIDECIIPSLNFVREKLLDIRHRNKSQTPPNE